MKVKATKVEIEKEHPRELLDALQMIQLSMTINELSEATLYCMLNNIEIDIYYDMPYHEYTISLRKDGFASKYKIDGRMLGYAKTMAGK